MAKVVKISRRSIKLAAELLRNGEIVIFPTETVYGLGASVFNPEAVAKIFEVKRRPRFDPLIIHIAAVDDMPRLCQRVGERAEKLAAKFWPGPLTLILPKKETVPDIVTAGLPNVAVRMPAHPVALSLIQEAGTPIAAPSANLFGRLSPTAIKHIPAQLKNRVALILDAGKTPIGVESTVLSLVGKDIVLLRPGGLPIEDIEKIVGKVKLPKFLPAKPNSPGQLPQHYSPRTPLKIINRNINIDRKQKIGLLSLTPPSFSEAYAKIAVLSTKGDLREAAANLFECLHELDQAGLDIIYAEPVPKIGLGRAIMDRLERAAQNGANSKIE
ncbi:MAG: L-threonylcarbamoyladenylate synthase [bacterium]|nr:L-threonylcarbamoyladenylate synthase [bacterium]